MRIPKNRPIANSLLAALSRAQYQRLADGLEQVIFRFGEVLYEPGEAMRHVYFPSKSLVSLLTLVDDRMALEIGMVGPKAWSASPCAWAWGYRQFAPWCREPAARCA